VFRVSRAVAEELAMKVFAAVAAVTVSLGLCVAGCSPAMDERMAVRMTGVNSVEVRLLLCAHYRVELITVTENLSTAGRWHVENQPGDDRPDQPEWFSATLLDVPSGWTLVDNSVSRLADGNQYHLYVGAVPGGGLSVDFTMADLRDLDETDVWVATQRGGHARSRDDFERRTHDGCG
jgi:hypothetical protein